MAHKPCITTLLPNCSPYSPLWTLKLKYSSSNINEARYQLDNQEDPSHLHLESPCLLSNSILSKDPLLPTNCHIWSIRLPSSQPLSLHRPSCLPKTLHHLPHSFSHLQPLPNLPPNNPFHPNNSNHRIQLSFPLTLLLLLRIMWTILRAMLIHNSIFWHLLKTSMPSCNLNQTVQPSKRFSNTQSLPPQRPSRCSLRSPLPPKTALAASAGAQLLFSLRSNNRCNNRLLMEWWLRLGRHPKASKISRSASSIKASNSSKLLSFSKLHLSSNTKMLSLNRSSSSSSSSSSSL